MKELRWTEEEFLESIREDSDDDLHCLNVWWLGQSGFLIRHCGKHLLIDPYLSDSLTKKYAGTDKPHARIMPRLVAPERLNFIDVVSSSHNHTDHLDPETLRPLFAVNPELVLVAPEANRGEAAFRAGIDPSKIAGVDDGTSAEVKGFKFTGIPAAHNTVERDAQGQCKFLGYIIDAGPFRIYHSGDTLVYEGLAERLNHFHPIELALLPINGDRPERRVAGNMNGVEAARLAKAIDCVHVTPCHYDMFEFNTASTAEFETECRRLNIDPSIALVGQHHTLYTPREEQTS